jgi:hypothetical protein
MLGEAKALQAALSIDSVVRFRTIQIVNGT